MYYDTTSTNEMIQMELVKYAEDTRKFIFQVELNTRVQTGQLFLTFAVYTNLDEDTPTYPSSYGYISICRFLFDFNNEVSSLQIYQVERWRENIIDFYGELKLKKGIFKYSIDLIGEDSLYLGAMWRDVDDQDNF